MSTSDEHPRPRYGEYATPEEQRARIRVPDASASLDAGEAPQAVRPAPRAQVRPQPVTPAGAPSQRTTFDRVLTIGLLGFGLFNVITGIPSYLDYPTLADSVIRAAGVDAVFTNLEQGRVWGLVAALVLGVMWFVTAVLSSLQLRRGRLAFWIPLAGALIAGLLVGLCLMVPLLGDAAFMDALVTTPTPAP